MVVSYLLDHRWGAKEIPVDTDQYLKVNSQAARKRKAREILNRVYAVPRIFWEHFISLKSREEKNTFLYYVCMKYYPLVRDFHFEVVLDKWRLLDPSLDVEHVSKFLKKASNQHPEIDEWKESTLKKIGQVLFLMLKEVGIINRNRLRLVFLPDTFWLFFIRQGEGWFLEAMFLTREQRDLLYKKAGL